MAREATAEVLESGLPIELVGWDVARAAAVVDEAMQARIRAIDSHHARFALTANRRVVEFARERRDRTQFSWPDPLAMAIAIDAGVATFAAQRLAVRVGDHNQRGRVVAISGTPNARVAISASRERFVELVEAALS